MNNRPTNLIALETSSRSASVATLAGDRLLHTGSLAPSVRSAQGLVPLISEILERTSWRPVDIQAIAVTVGPGSFTGLRVGVTTAKTMAYALSRSHDRIPVLGIDSLQTIAHQVARSEVCPNYGPLHVIMDAYRGQVFAATFTVQSKGMFTTDVDSHVVDWKTWRDNVPAAAVVAGPALTKFAAELPPGVTTVPPHLWEPTAEAVGILGYEKLRLGMTDDFWSLSPAYLRSSAAEEKLPQSPK